MTPNSGVIILNTDNTGGNYLANELTLARFIAFEIWTLCLKTHRTFPDKTIKLDEYLNMDM